MNVLIEQGFESRAAFWADTVAALRRHKLLVLFVTLATVGGAYATLQLILTERYETTSRLLVKLGRENTEIPTTVQNGSYYATGIRKEELNSEVQLLSSRNLVERVVDTLGVDAFKFEPQKPKSFLQAVKYLGKKAVRWGKEQAQAALIALNLKKELSEREKAILLVEGGLDVEAEKDSDVINVRLKLPDPELCVRVSETLLQVYFEQHTEVRRASTAVGFFDDQVSNHKRQLDALQRMRGDIRNKWNLSAVDEQRSLLLKQLSEIYTQIEANESDKAMLQQQQVALRARLAALPEALRSSEVVANNPAVRSIKEQITTLKLERAKLANRYVEGSVIIKNYDREIAKLEELLAQEAPTRVESVTSSANPLRQSFIESIEQNDVKIAGLEAKTRELSQPIAGIKQQLAGLNIGQDQIEVVERERKLAEQNYLSYTKRVEEDRVSEELDRRRVANVNVLSPPEKPIEPIYPRKLLIMGIAFPAGLLLGIVFALLAEYLSDKVSTPQDLSDLEGLPFLGTFQLPGH